MMDSTLSHIQNQRDAARLSPATIRVFHRDGQSCQLPMRHIGGSLTQGATEYRGTFYCLKCDTAVEVIITAPPDVPYELFEGKRVEDIVPDEQIKRDNL